MMSEYYDQYHRWEPLAEFHFNVDGEEDIYEDENYIYCLCSRAFIRDGVKTYYVDKEDISESDFEVLQDSPSQDLEDHSHVHFSVDTSFQNKCEKDEGASCYCSASHTDNYCSTDEHDPQLQGVTSNALQPSDSGADLTYQDCHSDYTNHDKVEKMEQDFDTQTTEITENYHSEDTWDKFWAVNGERIIWASWIKKYSDYINPSYLDENHDLLLDENNVPKQQTTDTDHQEQDKTQKVDDTDNNVRERKFSYDSKINPYRKNKPDDAGDKIEKSSDSTYSKEDAWLPLNRRRSCSEHERIVSPRTFAGTDSMTNVTKITLSSYDITSSHITSESTSPDGYSVSSSPSEDQSNDQTRIANLNVDENFDQESEEMDTEQYWQFLWKKHFGEQYALHYANYIESHASPNVKEDEDPPIIDSVPERKVSEIDLENSEGNSQEMPSVIEVQEQVDKIKLDDKVTKQKKRTKKSSSKYIGSVGFLLQNLLKEQQLKESEVNEVQECSDGNDQKQTNEGITDTAEDNKSSEVSNTQILSNSNLHNHSYDDGDEDPPEEKPVSLKRSHEVDEEEVSSEKIQATFEIMGFCLDSENMPKGQLVYRKRVGRLRPPRYKKFGVSKKTYFDDDGNPCQGHESQEEREMQTDNDCQEAQIDQDRVDEDPIQDKDDCVSIENITFDVQNKVIEDNQYNQETDVVAEASTIALPSDIDNSLSDTPDNNERETKYDEEVMDITVPIQLDQTKRRRRPKRYSKFEGSSEEINTSDMPPELAGEPKMKKYWKKRHSLFHRFDEGIKLDRESWFSVTPENVAWHIASKFAFDTVIDAFCGAGGNTIQFARTCKKVIAIDIDPLKIDMAKHNASVYGVDENIEFIVGDFFELAPKLSADMVFLSPPWGGPNYSENYQYDIETMLEPKPASELMRVARTITSNVALYLPRNTKSDQILSLAQEAGGSVEVEQSYLDKRFVAITAYFY